MLAISVREALRDAIAAFGVGEPVLLESPATPERVFFAIQRARAERESLRSPVGTLIKEASGQ
jgi:xanthine dehydrogenase large subunit